MTDRKIVASSNTEKRISVHETTRRRLRERKDDGESYSDQIRDLVPADSDEFVEDDDLVTISLDQETYERVMTLAGDGVPARSVIEYFLLRELIDAGVSPYDVLDEVYSRDEVL